MNLLGDKYEISVLTSSNDLNDSKTLPGIELYKWNKVDKAHVYYMTPAERNYSFVKKIILGNSYDAIYINGLYSLPFMVSPLIIWKMNLPRCRLVLSPRGMLQEGALKIKPFKKKLFLIGMKLLGLCKGITWHATNEQEKKDIQKIFKTAHVIVAENIPKKPWDAPSAISKTVGELKLVYLSLISKKKNLAFALNLINKIPGKVSLDIYGPVKDEKYWTLCQTIIDANKSVKYKGNVLPCHVQETFSEYHALLLPTLGENFGHAIYECMSVGRPVIISNTTPWRYLQEKYAGFDVDLEDTKGFEEAIDTLMMTDEKEFSKWTNGALLTAKQYWQNVDLQKTEQMFL